MTLFDWLTTPQGTAVVNALIVLIVALAGLATFLAHQAASAAAADARLASQEAALAVTKVDAHVKDAVPCGTSGVS